VEDLIGKHQLQFALDAFESSYATIVHELGQVYDVSGFELMVDKWKFLSPLSFRMTKGDNYLEIGTLRSLPEHGQRPEGSLS
jgi:hypothetical protein